VPVLLFRALHRKDKIIQMPKFFVEPSKVNGTNIVIDTEDVSHITRVLRMAEGDKITVCDSCGIDYEAEITDISKNEIICKILSSCKSDTEPAVSVTLYQALPKASKMEYIIQKTTELGVSAVVPVIMARCVSKINDKKDGVKKAERWRKIAESAAKQSGRGIIPTVEEPITFDEAVSRLAAAELSFAPYECEEENTVKKILRDKTSFKEAAFIIGPEGGFDPAEIDKLKNSGVKTVTLGKRILRTETAGEAVVAMIMYETDM